MENGYKFTVALTCTYFKYYVMCSVWLLIFSFAVFLLCFVQLEHLYRRGQSLCRYSPFYTPRTPEVYAIEWFSATRIMCLSMVSILRPTSSFNVSCIDRYS